MSAIPKSIVNPAAYSGADIKQVVITGLKLAFHESKALTTAQLRQAAPEVRLLSRTDPVAEMTAWLGRHTKPANAQAETLHTGSVNRTRRTVVE